MRWNDSLNHVEVPADIKFDNDSNAGNDVEFVTDITKDNEESKRFEF